MGCGCTEKKAEAVASDTGSGVDLMVPHARWHVVVVSADVHPGVYALLDQVKALDVCWCVVDTSYKGTLRDEVKNLGGAYVHFPTEEAGRFNWPAAVNVGAAVRAHADRYLFLHDDVILPDINPLPAFEAALSVDHVGIAVPRVEGACANDAQTVESDLPWFPTSEFVSACCMAMRGKVFHGVALDERMDGYDWQHIHLQATLAAHNHCAAVVPSVTVAHAGMQTYQVSHAKAGWLPNMERFALWNGSGKAEYDARPKICRLPVRTGGLRSLILTIDSEASWAQALRIMADGDNIDCAETIIVDGQPSAERQEKCLRLPRVVYAPDYGGLKQAINLASCPRARVYELQTGSPLPAVPVESPRMRTGWEWNMPPFMDELNLGYLRHAGLGDTLMSTPALAAFKRLYPHVRIIVHHSWQADEVLQYNPDVDEVKRYSTASQSPPPDLYDMMGGTGGEHVIKNMYANLGIQDMADGDDRRIRYYLQRHEHDAAVALLRSLAPSLPDVPRLVGVQLHGGWETKAWKHSADLVARLLSEGVMPVLFGIDAERMPDIPRIKECIQIDNQTIRMAIAVVALLDTWVGFDSGLTYAASGVGTSAVALFGSHDPRGLIIETTSPNLIAIRRKTPADCMKEHGRSCHGGGKCPLREGVGADCIDAISVDDVMDSIAALPTWGEKRLEERFHALS